MQLDEVQSMSDKEILDELRAIGVSATLEEFKRAALEAGAPSRLSDEWASRHGIEGTSEDFLYEASLELWKRHLADVKCAEAVQDSIYDVISYHDNMNHHNKDSLLKIYKGIETFYRFCLKGDGSHDLEFYNEVNEDAYDDIESFLLHMPFEFARYGLIDEAINIGRWFADISSQPENFYRDMGCILAEAGRREEAIKQVEVNLKRFPEDVWVAINAGDAFYSLGDKKSEQFFLRGYQMAGDNEYDKAGALERLIDFYRWQGMEEKARASEEEHRILTAPPPLRSKQVVKSKNIGRNDPCPCGSGKKYKKCCLNKDAT
jgi:tetratricopeptide (TPR) repeat protein